MGHFYTDITYTVPACNSLRAVTAGSCTITTPKTGSLWNVKLKAGAGGATVSVRVPVCIPAGGQAIGFVLRSVDLWYSVSMAVTSVDVAICSVALPADGAAFGVVTSHTFTYDAAHNDAAERIRDGNNKLTCTLAPPTWLETTRIAWVQYELVLGADGEILLIMGR